MDSPHAMFPLGPVDQGCVKHPAAADDSYHIRQLNGGASC
jgi:hypothetical protein